MRSKKQMMKSILDFANRYDSVRAVYLNGSRANPNVEKDKWRDYDVVYVVRDPRPFVEDTNWIEDFGEIAIMQDPNIPTRLFPAEEVDISKQYNWLVLFADHNRMDITMESIEVGTKNFLDDSLTVLLLDKDGIMPEIPEPSEKDYYITKPTKIEYNVCVNEFYWCLQNVAKGIARNQLPYAMKMYNRIVRNMLDYMVDWYIGCENGFSVNVGMWGKYYSKYLDKQLYELYEKTYSDANTENIWQSIYAACDLFKRVSIPVAKHFVFTYNVKEEESMMKYFDYIRENSL